MIKAFKKFYIFILILFVGDYCLAQHTNPVQFGEIKVKEMMYTADGADNTFAFNTNTITINGDTQNLKDNPKFIIKGEQITVIGAENPESEDVEFKDISKLKFDKDTGFSVISTNQEEVLIKMNSAWTELIPDLNGQEFSPDYSGEWSNDGAYEIGEIVLYDSEYWICKEANEGEQPDDSDKWLKLGNLKPQGEEKLAIKVVESDEPGTYWDYSQTNKNEKTFNIGVGKNSTKIEIDPVILDESQLTIDLNSKNEIYFSKSNTTTATDLIVLPDSDSEKLGNIVIYVKEVPPALFDFNDLNILSYPTYRPWLDEHTGESVWRFEFVSFPGVSYWTFSKATKNAKEFPRKWLIENGIIVATYPKLSGDIVFPESFHNETVIGIAENAFTDNNDIISLTFPNTLESIYQSAFANCSNLTILTLGDNLQLVGKNSFAECDNVNNIIYNRRIDEIDPEDSVERITALFEDSGLNLDNVTLTALEPPQIGETILTYTDGTVVTKDIYGIFDGQYIDGNKQIASIQLGTNITGVGSHSLYSKSSLTNVSFPNTDTQFNLNYAAFAYNSGLKKIILPKNVYFSNSGSSPFYFASSLDEFKVSRYNQTLSSEDGILFNKDKTAIIQVPAEKNIEEYIIPDSISDIWYAAFAQNCHLKSIVFPESMSLISISGQSGQFRECRALTNVVLPRNLQTLPYSIFYECNSLKNIDIPETVTYIGSQAFYNCYNLENIELPYGLTYIDNGTFYNCSNLKDIIIPNTITNIYSSAFYNCNSLTNIVFSSNLQRIDSQAFQYTGVNEVVLPDSLTYLSDGVFSQNQNLTNVVLSKNLEHAGYSTFSGCSNLKELTLCTKLNPGDIDSYSFNDVNNISTIKYYRAKADKTKPTEEVESKVKEILSYAGCGYIDEIEYIDLNPPVEGWNYELDDNEYATVVGYYPSISGDITIPDSIDGYTVVEIGESAFDGNIDLTSIVVPQSVTNIGKRAFKGCDNLVSLTMTGKSTQDVEDMKLRTWGLVDTCVIHCTDGDLYPPRSSTIFYYNNGNIVTNYIEGALTQGNVPDSSSLTNIDIGVAVTAINEYALSNTQLSDLVLPNSITSIGRNAFYNSQLTSIVIPESVSQSEGIFQYCRNLTNIVLPNNWIKIPSSMFYECSNLQHIDISDSISEIGYSAFSYCQNLHKIIIPDSVQTISYQAFYNSGLMEITIPESVTQLGWYAFYNCYDLRKVTFLGNTISDEKTPWGSDGNPFSNSGLETVEFTTNATVISSNMFRNCSNLYEITIGTGLETVGAGAFDNTQISTVHYIRRDSEKDIPEETLVAHLKEVLNNSGYDFTNVTFEEINNN